MKFNWFKKKKNKGTVNNNSSVQLMTSEKPSKDRYIERSISDLDTFYRDLVKEIAILGACVKKWKTLCSTPSRYVFEGKDNEIAKAEEVVATLDDHLYSDQGTREGGIQIVTNSFFTELFTVGRFAFEIIPTKTGDGVDRIHQYNTYEEILWVEDLKRGTKYPWIQKFPLENEYRRPSPFFYYNALNKSFRDPAGHSLLYSIEWIARIEEQLLLDMACASHNVGYPRAHMKIKPPEPFSGESRNDYIKRMDNYFDNTVNNFKKIEIDDNIFTWDSINIEIVGAKTAKTGYPWRENVEVTAEEILSAYGLYPWVLGLSHGATKNWVEVQYNTLLTDIANLQTEASAIAEFIVNLELKLKGINVIAKYIFEENENPNIDKRRDAEATHFGTVHNKFLTGYIDKNTAAQELGYNKPFNNDRIELNKKEKSNGKDNGKVEEEEIFGQKKIETY